MLFSFARRLSKSQSFFRNFASCANLPGRRAAALEIALQEENEAESAFQGFSSQTTAKLKLSLRRTWRFDCYDATNFGDTLRRLLASLEEGFTDQSDIKTDALIRLTDGCERWTNPEHMTTRQPTDIHTVLRLHSELGQPLSPALRSNARLWLSAKCRCLPPADLVSFFGSLSTLTCFGDSVLSGAAHQTGSCFRSPWWLEWKRPSGDETNPPKPIRPSSEPSLTSAKSSTRHADLQFLSQVACHCQAHGLFNQASVADLIRFLTDFRRMGISPTRFEPQIVDDLIARLTDDCNELPLDGGLELLEAIGRLNLKPDARFWAAFERHFASVEPKYAGQLLGSMQRLVVDGCVLNVYAAAVIKVWVETVASGLEQMCLDDLLISAQALGAQPDRGLLHLTNNDKLWPALMHRAARVRKHGWNWQSVQALVRVLRWAPNRLHAKVDALAHSIKWDLRDGVVDLMCLTDLEPPSPASKRSCQVLRGYLLHIGRLHMKSLFRNGKELWTSRLASEVPVEDVFHGLATFNEATRGNFLTLPTADWWTNFRLRLSEDQFRPHATNWLGIVQTIGKLAEVRNNMAKHHSDQSLSSAVDLLPADWYPMFLQLASSLPLAEGSRANLDSINALFRLLRYQQIQFDGDLQMTAASLLQRFCCSTNSFVPTLCHALSLGLSVSDVIWARLSDLELQAMHPVVVNRLVDLATNYWALKCQSEPLSKFLQRLVRDTPYKEVTCRWQKLHLMLGDEFMPPELLLDVNGRRRACSDTLHVLPRGKVDGKLRPKLEQLLMLEYGGVRIERNAVLSKAAGRRVDYLMTKADGSQVALFCDLPFLHYWLVPNDVQGELTLAFRALICMVEKAGFPVHLVKMDNDD